MKKCPCMHLGNCPFQKLSMRMTYLDGVPIFRQLTEEELKAATISTPKNPALNPAIRGDSVASDGAGTVVVAARAVEPDRCVEYVRSFSATRCKANSFMWRKRHGYPKAAGDA